MPGPKTTRPEPLLDTLAEFRFQIRHFLHFSEQAAARAGLRAQQYQLLQVVAAAPQHRLPAIADVAERLMLRHNSAVELVDRTQQQGLLLRVADKEDHRRTRLKLSTRGKRLLTRLVNEHLEELQQWGPQMRTALEAVMEKVWLPAKSRLTEPKP